MYANNILSKWNIFFYAYKTKEESLYFYGYNQLHEVEHYLSEKGYGIEVIEKQYIERADTHFRTIATLLPDISPKKIKFFILNKELYSIAIFGVNSPDEFIVSPKIDTMLLNSNRKQLDINTSIDETHSFGNVVINDKYLNKKIKKWIMKWS